MKVGITFSTFDLLHAGHIKMLEDAKTQFNRGVDLSLSQISRKYATDFLIKCENCDIIF